MLQRCPECNKLYPQHHKECGYCATRKSSAPPVSKPTLASKPLQKPAVPQQTAPVQAPLTSVPVQSEPSPSEEKLHFAEIPKMQQKKEGGAWNSQSGGDCRSCKTFNPPGNVFCSYCRSMLVQPEEEKIITSYPLKEIKGLLPTFIPKLNQMKIANTEDLLRVGCSKKNRQLLIQKTGLSERSLLRLVYISDLCRIPAINPERACMLELAGITNFQSFVNLAPDKIFQKIQQAKRSINEQGILVLPSQKLVEQWFTQAQQVVPMKIEV